MSTPKQAVAYFRTSSVTNIAGDSEERQRVAVHAFAAREGYAIVAEHYDAAVSGADSIHERPGFRRVMLDIAKSGARTILVETANRFARDLIVQETGWRHLQAKGVDLIAVDSPQAFVEDTPSSRLIRQILGALSEFERAAVTARLRGARIRTGKLGGRRPIALAAPEATARARQLSGNNSAISRQLALEGHFSSTGRPFKPSVVGRMRRQAKT